MHAVDEDADGGSFVEDIVQVQKALVACLEGVKVGLHGGILPLLQALKLAEEIPLGHVLLVWRGLEG